MTGSPDSCRGKRNCAAAAVVHAVDDPLADELRQLILRQVADQDRRLQALVAGVDDFKHDHLLGFAAKLHTNLIDNQKVWLREVADHLILSARGCF